MDFTMIRTVDGCIQWFWWFLSWRAANHFFECIRVFLQNRNTFWSFECYALSTINLDILVFPGNLPTLSTYLTRVIMNICMIFAATFNGFVPEDIYVLNLCFRKMIVMAFASLVCVIIAHFTRIIIFAILIVVIRVI